MSDTIRCPVCGYDYGISVEDPYADPAECPACIEAEMEAEDEAKAERSLPYPEQLEAMGDY
ncbi:hypothetical protein Metev_0658 [Methanohalobium evestigatum Z-7303]|uniref:Rubredoxin-like domain-containing protein n=1 Tax=Methanohalobium evestigatum (strain ATCC BAA-1072 / DSM 3721 / NBRC 107634 / OCM 161 / Z-7303) TaxID=644295 RepID=D7E6U0_METEZ|nr:hypothetical protein [Methanohalobium evestigatum]ADI73564.1 hypothetical protein Metev_0658 [Methanohalobium evestigatum Z-7303]